MGPVCCAVLLAACGQQPGSSPSAVQPQSTPASEPLNDTRIVPTTAAGGDDAVSNAVGEAGTDWTSHGSQERSCYLEVDGVVAVDGPCLVFPMGPDEYTLNTWDHGKPAHSHFAIVTRNADGTAKATWNADPDDDRAFDPLGDVHKQDGCWVNDRARICVR